MTIPADQIESVCALLRAAMESKEHVFVDWSPHVERVYVKALPASTKYVKGHGREALIDQIVRLGGEAAFHGDDPITELRELTERIRSLG